MSFNNLYFLFVFLPIALLLYYVVPKRFRNIPLLLINIVFYAWGNPTYIVLIAFSVLFNYIAALEISEFKSQERASAAKFTVIFAVVINILLLGFYKYYGFLLTNINAITGLKLQQPNLPLPLGVSFYTFTVLSYVFDVYRDRAPAEKNLLNCAVYVTFFPKVVSGPIVQYKDMAEQIAERKMNPPKFGAGMNTFIVGLAKKVIIADNLGTAFTAISGMSAMSAGTAWLGMIFYSLQLYFDFSGYSDMAIGLAKMFGFDFEKNFDYPYLSSSVSEFWRRWHITLGAWFRDYVYIPMGGSRCSTGKIIRNLAVVWLLTGLWHGASWNFIAWGVFHGIFVILEKYPLKNVLPKIPKPIRIFLTVLEAFLGWVMFFSPTMSAAIAYYGQMFGAGHMGLFDSTFAYYLTSNLLLLIIAIIGCGPIPQKLHQRLTYYKGGLISYVSIALFVLLFILCIACIVNSTYSSFLYFQF